MKGTMLLLAGSALIVSAVAIAKDGKRPLPGSKEFGQRIVAEWDVPDEIIEKFQQQRPGAPNKKLSPLENTLFAKTTDWVSPEGFSVDSTKNPYTIVVSLVGTAPAAGDAFTFWTVGWADMEGGTRSQPLSGLTKHDVKAGERVYMTAGGSVTSFKKDGKYGASISLMKVENFNFESVHVQVWQGVPKASFGDLLTGFYPLWVGGGMLVFWWFFLRRR